MPIQITVDARSVIARFSPAGIPEQVRANLRRTIPALIRKLAAKVDAALDAGLKSRARLKIDPPQGEMVENAQSISGRVRVIWTGDQAASMVPQVLESGAVAHPIEAKNAGALAFFFPAMGRMAFFKRVWHPGFPGIRYMQGSFQDMESEIFATIDAAVKQGAAR
jgi:hypothetical protein